MIYIYKKKGIYINKYQIMIIIFKLFKNRKKLFIKIFKKNLIFYLILYNNQLKIRIKIIFNNLKLEIFFHKN